MQQTNVSKPARLTSEQKILVEQNLGLAITFAQMKHKKELDFQDLIAIGYYGLVRAALTFKPELGWKFSHHAIRRMRAELGHECQKESQEYEAIKNYKHYAEFHDNQPVDEAIQHENQSLVQDAIEQLTPAQKAEARGFLAGLSTVQIAKKRGISFQASQRNRKKAMENLGWMLVEKNL